MAQVTRDTVADVEFLLGVLLAEWWDMAELTREPAGMDPGDLELFQVEWGLTKERFKRLQAYVERDVLTPRQQAQYHDLLQLMAYHRPVVEQLLADERR